MSGPLRAVLVDDSLVQRAHLSHVLQADGDIEVVAEAPDAATAVAAVAEHRPDVVTMDLELPGGGGRRAIEEIMAATPTPILVLSGIIDDAFAQPAVEALAAGAVEAMPKPLRWTGSDEDELRTTVRRCAAMSVAGPPPALPIETDGPVIGIAAGAGGPAALTALLRGLAVVQAPVLVVQQLHSAFTTGFLTWLEGAVPLPVRAAAGGVTAEPATVYVAPADAHLALGPERTLELRDEPGEGPRPSADILFGSMAEHAGPRGIGVVLTGAGDDGAAGLLALSDAGGTAFAQDEASCTVFSMPRAARVTGATDVLLPPQRLAGAVLAAVETVRETA